MASDASIRSPLVDQSEEYDYHLLVIGAGPGGLVAAKQAAARGRKVGLVESNSLGGTCVNRGCVPKKLMYYAAVFSQQMTIASSYGWSQQKASFDWKSCQSGLQKQLAKIRDSIESSTVSAGVHVIRGRAKFLNEHRLLISSQDDGSARERLLSAQQIIIAVGGQPIELRIPGIERALRSPGLFTLEKLPQSLIIVGGGYVGVEFSSIFNALGVEVTLVDTDSMPLQHFDQALQLGIRQNMEDQGIQFVPGASLSAIKNLSEDKTAPVLLEALFSNAEEANQGGCQVQQRLQAEQILVTTGRQPNLKFLDVEAAGIELENGAIAVNNHYQTSQPHIYALGDCIDRLPLTPVAHAEAHCVIEQLYGDGGGTLDYRWVPSAVFAMPPAASVGWTEAQSREKCKNVAVYLKEITPLSHVLSEINPHNQLKWIVDGDTDQVLGLHLIGASAPDIVQSISPLLRDGTSYTALQQSIGIHPTLGEELFDV